MADPLQNWNSFKIKKNMIQKYSLFNAEFKIKKHIKKYSDIELQ